jgi:hypothetical protein
MPQLSYPFLMDIGSVGLLADSGFRNVLSPIAFENFNVGLGLAKVIGQDYVVRLPQSNLSTAIINADLVTGNVINVSINGVALAPINFATSSAATMNAIAAAILAQPHIASAVVSDPNSYTLTVTATESNVAIVNSFVVTGGASQATATITNTTQDTFYGVGARTQNRPNPLNPLGSFGSPIYHLGDCVSLLTRGRIYVVAEQNLTSDSPVYWRFAANGLLLPGGFRADSDGGLAIALPTARYTLGATAGSVAIAEINLPN